MIRILILSFVLCVGAACSTSLKTRENGVGKASAVPPISEVRRKNAELTAELMNYEEELRSKKGRIEELEVYIAQLEKTHEDELEKVIQERDAYKDSLSLLNSEKKELLKELALLGEEKKEASKKLKWASQSDKKMLETGDQFFEEKKWAEAVSAYQSFREKTSNKKSAEYALVTYKIGVCFQELGLKDEAITFYKSVVEGFKKDYKAHKYASYRLSQLTQE